MNKYSDNNPLYAIARAYDENTRMLMFHSTELEAKDLQEALDIIGEYNDFDSKLVGKTLLEHFGREDVFGFVVGREYSPVVYVVGKRHACFWLKTLKEVAKKAKVDEVSVDMQGRLRLWWD